MDMVGEVWCDLVCLKCESDGDSFSSCFVVGM